jgi:hypothetical protein
VLYLGTMFAPSEDRGEKGMGFTHAFGDIVTVSAPELGALTNVMASSEDCPPWTFGIGALMRNLALRTLHDGGSRLETLDPDLHRTDFLLAGLRPKPSVG